MARAFLACCAVLLVAGCSSSSRPNIPTVEAARTFALSGFRPARVTHPGTARLSFTIRQPDGKPLTKYRTGAGPHTGVHLIVVRNDLSVIIHRHPPIGRNGHVVQPVDFPAPGPYRVLIDAYPALGGALRNFQLHAGLRVGGSYKPSRLPAFAASESVDGYRVLLTGAGRLRALEPAHVSVRVRNPSGRPVRFTPWYGALAHAIFFRVCSLDYFHTHVCGPSTPGCTSILGGARVVGRSTRPGRLQVGVLLPIAGTWRLFLQFQAGGRVLTAPFTLRVS